MTIGHLAKSGCPILYGILPIKEPNRRFSVHPPLDCSIGHTLAAWQSGTLQSQCARFLYAILPAEESNRRFSIQPSSDHSIDHALAA